MKMIRKLCIVLACLIALCCTAFAEEMPACLPEDFAGEWQLSILVENGQHLNVMAWGIDIRLMLEEDGSASMDYGDGNPTEMSWRFEDGKAYIAGYNAEKEIEIGFYEDGSLLIADEMGEMYFVRPAEAEAG